MQQGHGGLFFRLLRITLIWVFCLGGLHACGGGGSSTQPTDVPVIDTAPVSQTVSAGQTVIFSTQARDEAQLTYQWQRNGVDIRGATATFYRQKVQLGDTGSVWTVRVSNTAGSVTSAAATLSVLAVPTGTLSLLAGSAAGPGNLDGAGPLARFIRPSYLAMNADGTLYIADSYRIRKMTSTGEVTTLAGTGQRGYLDGQSSAAMFDSTGGLAVDAAGNTFVSDWANNVIRKITPAGLVATLAGTPLNSSVTFGSGDANRFNAPTGLGIDAAGNLYVADSGNFSIKKITPSGMVTMLAGGNRGSADGIGTAASFDGPNALALDPAGQVYVVDGTRNIRKISTEGSVTTVFSGSPGLQISGIFVDSAGNVLVSGNNVIRQISPSGALSVVAGTVDAAGTADGPAANASFSYPSGLTMDRNGNLYVADNGNSTIRRVTPAGMVSTLAGAAIPTDTLNYGAYHAIDSAGNVYVSISAADSSKRIYGIQKITPAGVATTLASGLTLPQGIAVDAVGNVYVADQATPATLSIPYCPVRSGCDFPGVVRKISPQGDMTTLAGSFNPVPAADGVGASASLINPGALTLDAAGNLYVAEDSAAGSIRKITPTGVVTTFATLYKARGLALDQDGNVYAAVCIRPPSSGFPLESAIYKISPAGVPTRLTGTTTLTGSVDGGASNASFNCPTGVAADGAGNLYVADTGNHTIRRLSKDGTVTTVAGQAGFQGITLGALPATLAEPTGVSVDALGNLYVGDARAILKINFTP